ncbi:MAG TPA: ribonuclease [Spirochaetia bacterium]|nr:ribonuclease [Spirochaetia bacterium]
MILKKKPLFLFFLIFTLFFFSSCQKAQKNKENYYSEAIGKKGSELKTALHEIIREHQKLPYSKIWDALCETDADPDLSGNVILVYSGWSVSKKWEARGKASGNNSYWNREHIWPKNRGKFETSPGIDTDLHNLKPEDKTVNAKRGNLDFDEGGEIYKDPDGETENRFDEDSWEPRKEVRGDIARILFYMAVRYESEDSRNLELTETVNKSGGTPFIGKLSTLLKWHEEDPVDGFEKKRNEKIYQIQGNRNPFIDHPEWVKEIWK